MKSERQIDEIIALAGEAQSIINEYFTHDNMKAIAEQKDFSGFQLAMRRAQIRLIRLYLPVMDPESIRRASRTLSYLEGFSRYW